MTRHSDIAVAAAGLWPGQSRWTQESPVVAGGIRLFVWRRPTNVVVDIGPSDDIQAKLDEAMSSLPAKDAENAAKPDGAESPLGRWEGDDENV